MNEISKNKLTLSSQTELVVLSINHKNTQS